MIDRRVTGFIPDESAVSRLCDRRFGIGADGLIILHEAAGFGFRMQYYNADGKESSMCGNGGRCAVALADFLSYIPGKCRFLAADGEHEGLIISKSGHETIAKISMKDVPGISESGEDFILDTGSPHLVRFVQDLKDSDIDTLGRNIRHQDIFEPDGINVNFAEEVEGNLFVRTYERGVEAETLSCGTGVTASALVCAWKSGLKQGIIPVMTRGGMISVHFRNTGEKFDNIYLEGPAEHVFTGYIEI